MPTVIDKPGANAQPAAANQQPSARDRAIAKLMGGDNSQPAAQTPVSDPSNVAVEDLSAINGQSNSSEATAPSPEAPKAEPEAPKPAQDPLSKQYAILARKEKQMREQAKSLKAREDAIRAREEAAKSAPPAPSIDESKYIQRDRLAQDPLRALMDAGITYEQLTQLALNPPAQLDPSTRAALDQLKAETQSQKAAIEEMRKMHADQQTQAYQQAVTQIRTETRQLVNSNPDFETIKATNSVDDVVELIERTFKEEGTLLSVDEAAREVEEYLVEEAMKLAKLNKIQQKLKPAPATAAAAPQQKQPSNSQQQPLKTLTNATSTGRKLSSRERAILAFKGELKNS